MRTIFCCISLVVLCGASGCIVVSDVLHCREDSDCLLPGFTRCDQVTEQCEPVSGSDGGGGDARPDHGGSCASSATCPSELPICAAGVCRACASSTDDMECAGRSQGTPFCGAKGRCVGCRAQTDCIGNPAGPFCDASGACRKCTMTVDDAACSKADAAKPYCGSSGGCVACLKSIHCGGNTPVCEKESCRGCALHAECGSLVCLQTGGCVDPGDIAYVDNRGNTSTCESIQMQMQDGSRTKPWCSINKAVMNLAGRNYIRIEGQSSTNPLAWYAPIDLGDSVQVSLTLVGTDPGDPRRAVIADTKSIVNGIKWTPTKQATLTIDGLEIGPAISAPSTMLGVRCDDQNGASPLLRMVRSVVQRAAKTGILSNCRLSVERSRILYNKEHGIFVDGDAGATIDSNTIAYNNKIGVNLPNQTIYTITNNMIFSNDGDPAILLGNNAVGQFWFNTVASNANGVSCAKQQRIEASIFWSNGNSQFSNCTLSRLLTDNATKGDNPIIAGDPGFTNPAGDDYHIKSTSQAANRIDKASLGTDAPKLDIDAQNRPQNNMYDVGADEVN